MSVYNLKDLIRINQEIGETGNLRDTSSISFALDILKSKKSWLYELSYLVRSLIVDHPFYDGNKRTAYILCTLYFENNHLEYDDFELIKSLKKIASKNIIDINKIERLLKKC
ncbi:MAG: Fic family protein [Candidatus Nanoarchaeia archaeon]|nr:Fic family protein [Candidatus Nanoarchaeia archaeon]